MFRWCIAICWGGIVFAITASTIAGVAIIVVLLWALPRGWPQARN